MGARVGVFVDIVRCVPGVTAAPFVVVVAVIRLAAFGGATLPFAAGAAFVGVALWVVVFADFPVVVERCDM